ncbi:MAG: ribosomal-protein-alanine N-acetyltransferase [Rhodanobacter sp.]|nr:MAG: ribosomal-protein-alanine N-acetyltransferase [Rhodanobacter sp.]TAM06094.1 MAG: ribosomal-protein-alanine N-acetyltransferase [Rhodanobacter sp.]TAM39806.1 MAG: ribosomal-protein-alanine N-acetyltransferase [Rhodanobacter sp.]TAN29409.1 MAG: ribosomal-protein-alanine N-acetyltransferase [Rhodanobacter sp.]
MVAAVKPVIQIRGMRLDDLPAISAIENLSYEFPWSQGIFSDCVKAGHSCWVLCVDGVIAGHGILSTGADEAHLLNLCVGPAHRGRGLGRHLLGRLLDIAKWNRAERVFLEVRPSNPLARALYESVGFKQVGLRPRYYPAHGGREDAIVMVLEGVAGNSEK